jgi:Ca2+-binding EF-hand superfamily protein
VAILIQNLTGKAFETVDFRNKIFKKLYEEIYPNKEAQLLSLLQEFDKENNGMVKSKDVLVAL